MQLSVVFREDTAPAFNFVFKVLGPVVYLILCAVLFQSLKLQVLTYKCFFIVIYYWAFRLVWNIIYNRLELTDWVQLIIYWIASIGLALWVYSNIEKVDKILPDGKGLIDQMWILIIAFLYALFNQLNIGKYRTIKRKNNYINARYKKFKSEYNGIIHSYFHNNFYEALTYSIMIYEDFNRPPVVRAIEYINFFITHHPHTLGIMQVKTDTLINDSESVKLAVKKIARDANDYIRAKETEGEEVNLYGLLYNIAEKYNGGSPNYQSEISDIYQDIIKRYYDNQEPHIFTVLPV